MERSLLIQMGAAGPADAVGGEALETLLADMRLAEELDLHGAWLLPALDDEGGPAAVAVQVWLAAIAGRTTRLRLGWGLPGIAPPERPPIRRAEQAATLDVSSGGRLDLGILPDGALGADDDGASADWDEGLRMLVAMWDAGRFSWSSPRFRVPPVEVLPKPVQQPHPPLWLIGWTIGHARAAGQGGLAYLDVSGGSDRVLEQHRAAYHAARSEPVPAEREGDELAGPARFAAAMAPGAEEAGMQRLVEWESMGIDEAVLHLGEPGGDRVADRIRHWASGHGVVH